MINPQKVDDKIHQYLIHLFDDTETEHIHNFLKDSELFEERDYSSMYPDAIKLKIIIHPENFKKHNKSIPFIKMAVQAKYIEITQLRVTSIIVFPNLKKFQIIHNRYTPIETPWEEINIHQDIIIEQLKTATETIHFQNIGNTGRTIMQKLANIVFNPQKHKAPENIDLSEGKFKNRLHTYIKVELGGNENKEVRDFALSVIDTAEKSIDLSNKLTHSLNGDSFIAESCLVSTLSALNLIKIIAKQ